MSTATVKKVEPQIIPEYLIYEEIEGIPVYYQGYKDVVAGHKKLEDIMGSSRLQSLIISVLVGYFNQLFDKEFFISTNESGSHIEKGTNLSLDIALFKKEDLPVEKIDNHYFEEVPQIVFEVDTKADPSIEKHFSYIVKKTQKLLDFGTKQVVWIFTDPRKVMTATKDEPWLTVNWNHPITVLKQEFTLETFLREKGIIK